MSSCSVILKYQLHTELRPILEGVPGTFCASSQPLTFELYCALLGRLRCTLAARCDDFRLIWPPCMVSCAARGCGYDQQSLIVTTSSSVLVHETGRLFFPAVVRNFAMLTLTLNCVWNKSVWISFCRCASPSRCVKCDSVGFTIIHPGSPSRFDAHLDAVKQ